MKTTKKQAEATRRMTPAERAAVRYIEKGHREALDDFIAAMTEVRETIDCLRQEAKANFGVKVADVHFGHVGDANRILQALREVLAIARNENH